ncbi:MAG: hypothetical protein GC164_09495 [Phycisphaera sp.]|nr:hypothetical protein [Phycisphaera sp.]
MNRVKIGIIGCGVIGRTHIQSASDDPGIELLAVADIMHDRAINSAREHSVPNAYSSARELINNPDVDAVVLALVTSERKSIALEALKAGKHVLLEKPPAMNRHDLESIRVAGGGKVVGCCSSRLSYLEGADKAREVFESGALGKVRVARMKGITAATAIKENWTPPPWRVSHRLNGGGYLVNWGVYDLDYIMHVTAWTLRPRTVLAQTWPIEQSLRAGRIAPDSDAENHAVLMVRCEGGEVILHERGESVAMASELSWQVTGDKGSLRLNMLPRGQTPAVTLDTADAQNGLTSRVVLEKHAEDVQFLMPVRDFAAAIREGRPTRTSIDQAMVIQKIFDAAYESASKGVAVEID